MPIHSLHYIHMLTDVCIFMDEGVQMCTVALSSDANIICNDTICNNYLQLILGHTVMRIE
jgi:hypothetical protein